MARKVDTKYDKDLLKITHYKAYPQMMPFIGEKYDEKKLLVIGESHYLPECSEKSSDWYRHDWNYLDEEEKGWINTSELIRNTKYNKAHTIYKNIDLAFKEVFNVKDESWHYMAFMNFFQRPAEKTGKSIKVTSEDRDIANDTLKEVVNVLKPDTVIFVSSKAYRTYNNCCDKVNVFSGVHPACRWWNTKMRKYGQKTGKEFFVDIVSKMQNL